MIEPRGTQHRLAGFVRPALRPQIGSVHQPPAIVERRVPHQLLYHARRIHPGRLPAGRSDQLPARAAHPRRRPRPTAAASNGAIRRSAAAAMAPAASVTPMLGRRSVRSASRIPLVTRMLLTGSKRQNHPGDSERQRRSAPAGDQPGGDGDEHESKPERLRRSELAGRHELGGSVVRPQVRGPEEEPYPFGHDPQHGKNAVADSQVAQHQRTGTLPRSRPARPVGRSSG